MTRFVLAPAVALLSGSAAALDLRAGFPGATTGPGYVALPVNTVKRETSALSRRAAAANVDLKNYQVYDYTINVSLGTPGQTVEVVLDTGSQELWVDPICATASRAKNTSNIIIIDTPLTDPAACELRGNYNPSKSSSRADPKLKGTTFNYGDFTAVTIDYVADTLSLGGDLSIKNQIFGVAKQSNQTGVGIMGMGPSPFGFNNTGMYDLILTTMYKQGVIASPAFSLDLRDYDNTTGSIIFGGLDKKKFSGSLAKVPFETVQTKGSDGKTFAHYSYWVKVNSMAITLPGAKSSKGYKIPSGSFVADLDSGTGGILLPNGLATQLCADLNATSEADFGNSCTVDCALRQQPGGMTFSLNGKDIVVSYQNLITESTFNGVAKCTTSFRDSPLVSDPPTYILGAPFLRSAYAIFDWNTSSVHIAQAANCGTNIVSIGAGSSGTDASGECSFGVRSVAVNTGLLLGAALVGSLMLL